LTFDIAILFNVVERSGNYGFENEIPPPKTKVFNDFGAYQVFIEKVVVETSKRAHSIGN